MTPEPVAHRVLEPLLLFPVQHVVPELLLHLRLTWDSVNIVGLIRIRLPVDFVIAVTTVDVGSFVVSRKLLPFGRTILVVHVAVAIRFVVDPEGLVDVPVLEKELSDVAAVDGVLLSQEENHQLPQQDVRLEIDDVAIFARFADLSLAKLYDLSLVSLTRDQRSRIILKLLGHWLLSQQGLNGMNVDRRTLAVLRTLGLDPQQVASDCKEGVNMSLREFDRRQPPAKKENLIFPNILVLIYFIYLVGSTSGIFSYALEVSF